jgi:CelD/BcsL family acetyltransferase involved in cellulose biosynthesis
MTLADQMRAGIGEAVSEEPLDSLWSHGPATGDLLQWQVPFVLPAWLKAWWDVFGGGWEPRVLFVRSGGTLIGIAPLRLRGGEARFLGGVNVCDYLDFVTAPGREREFLEILLDHLGRCGVRSMDLRVLRPESAAVRFLPGAAETVGCEADLQQEDVAYEMELPSTWDGYLLGLSGHQRHEVRRKLRRLQETASFRLRVVEEPGQVSRGLETFLDLFRASRPDKFEFMDGRMETFFRAMTRGMASLGLLRLYLLDLAGRTVAAVLCLEHRGTTYLYNNGFDPGLGSLSLGTVSKVLTIRECIGRGRGVYDFLKGAEPYKKHLGGKPVPLYRCRVRIP